MECTYPRLSSVNRLTLRRREVTWEDPLAGAALALELSGLDCLRAIAEERAEKENTHHA